MSEKEEKLLEQIRDGLNYQYIVWFDGENFQLGCTKQELYQWLHCVRMWLNKAHDEKVSLRTVKNKIE